MSGVHSAGLHRVVAIVFALVSVLGYIAFIAPQIGNTAFDDAFMVARYAKHWLAGEGFSWNASDGPAYGITSAAYLFLITIVFALMHGSDAGLLASTSFVAGLLAVVAIIGMGFLTQSNQCKRRSWLHLFAVPAIVFALPFRQHSLTGMETTLSLLTNALLACAVVWVSRRRDALAVSICLAAGIATFITRPDNGLYAVFLPPLFFLATDRRLWRIAALYTLVICGLVWVSLVVNKALFGDYLPLPFYANSHGFYKGYLGAKRWNAMEAMWGFFEAASPFLLMTILTVSRQTWRQVVVPLLVVSTTFIYFGTVTQIMGWVSRYYYPSLPFVVLSCYLAVWGSTPDPISTQNVTISFTPLKLVLCTGLILILINKSVQQSAIQRWENIVIGSPHAVKSKIHYEAPSDVPLPSLGWMPSILAMSDLAEHLPEGTVLAASEYGILGARHPELVIVDILGLHDRTIAHNGFSADYVLDRQPDIIWFPHSDYTSEVAQLQDHPAFREGYDFYPGLFDYGVAIRRNSPRINAIEPALQHQFSLDYPGQVLSDHLARIMPD
jgi:hypothetical protein